MFLFLLTIAFSIALSAFNSLTFTPALSALVLEGEKEAQGGFFGKVEAALRGITSWYTTTSGQALRHRRALIVVFFLGLGATFWLFRTVPQSFVPDEDQSWFMVILQAPEGASLGYTTRVLAEAEAALAREPEVASSFSIGGFSFSGASPNRALIFTNMKPLSERKGAAHSVAEVVNRLRGTLGAISAAIVIPFLPPPLEGVCNFGGFQFAVQAVGVINCQKLPRMTPHQV